MAAAACSHSPFDISSYDPSETVLSLVADAPSRVEFVYLQTSEDLSRSIYSFLDSHLGVALRTELNSWPPQHVFEAGEIRWQVDWISRIVPQSGRALCVNFLMSKSDIGPTQRPVRFATMLHHPITRLAAEFLSFQKVVAAHPNFDEVTLQISQDIVAFADAHWRNNYLVRFFSGRDLCDPVNEKAERAADAALDTVDIVGTDQDFDFFADQLLALDLFAGGTLPKRGDCDGGAAKDLVATMDRRTRAALEQRNLADLALYDRAATGAKGSR